MRGGGLQSPLLAVSGVSVTKIVYIFSSLFHSLVAAAQVSIQAVSAIFLGQI